jgi:EmrB/QacA subfamily drug resistance transporter
MRKWLPLISICLGTFMLLIDVTIVNVALPDMARQLGSSFEQLQWVIDIYALALAALLLGIGALSDLAGRKPVYLGGLVLFAVSSLTAGLAGSTTVLIAARGVQGIGGAGMFATTIAVINSSYRGRDRGIAFGVWGAVNGAAAAAGPILGGLLTQGLSWRWIFFVNLPISVVAVALSMRTLAHERPATRARIDIPGVIAFTFAAGTATLAITRASENGWGAPITILLLAGAAVAAVGFVAIERAVARPILDLALLRQPSFSGVLAGAVLLSVAAFAYLAYSSLWLQSVRGMSPIGAGLTLIPLSLCSLSVSLSVGRHLHRAAPRWVIGGGLALIGAGALLQAHLGAGSDWTDLLPGLAVAGIGVGMATPTLASAALAAVPVERRGMAAGAVVTARQLGYAIGIALLGAICQSRIAGVLSRSSGVVPHARAAARALTGGQAHLILAATAPAHRAAADHTIHAAFASGLNLAFVVAGVAGLAGAAVVVVMLRPRPVREPAVAAEATAGSEVAVKA